MEVRLKLTYDNRVVGYIVENEGIEKYIKHEDAPIEYKNLRLPEVSMEEYLKGNIVEYPSKSKQIVAQSSSKGNQKKWFHSGIWYKEDFLGYEGKAEWVTSQILKMSTLAKQDYIEYFEVEIMHQNEVRKGCYSSNFLKEGETLITLARLFESNLYNYEKELARLNNKRKVSEVISKVLEFTNLNIEDYLRNLFTLDAFIFNEDRHFNNIAIIHNREKNSFRNAPIFDNGLSLLSDTKTYPEWISVIPNLGKVKSKPFEIDFEEQLNILGHGFKIYKKELEEFLDNSNNKLGRIKEVLEYSKVVYDYLLI